MAKFYGEVGYATTVEAERGIWVETVIERPYYGDVLKNTKQTQNGISVNDNINVNNIISIVSDPYANNHFFDIRYVKWMGTAWSVTNVEVSSPRLLLSIGGVYNGEQIKTT